MEFRKNYLMQVVARIDLSERAPWVDKLPKSITSTPPTVCVVSATWTGQTCRNVLPVSSLGLAFQTPQSP